MSPPGPALERLRIATWNVNSLRARADAIGRLLDRTRPDILCLQETRTTHPTPAAAALFDERGYDVVHVGDRSRNGVAIAARHPIRAAVGSGAFADPDLDREPRVATCIVDTPEPVRVLTAYVPHGRTVGHWHYHYKLAFLDALAAQVGRWRHDDRTQLVVTGDLNVAPTDSDVFHPDAFAGSTHVSRPERDALARLFDGLVDVDVARWGARARRFTWWRYGIGYSRNLGMRIDFIATDPRLAQRLDTTWIDHPERATAPASDHAALLADFHQPDP
jgi:exodeoxyribonuclease III